MNWSYSVGPVTPKTADVIFQVSVRLSATLPLLFGGVSTLRQTPDLKK